MNEPLPASTPPEDPAQQLESLWQQGQRPDVQEFLSHAGNLSPNQVIATLCVDQWHRWQHGDRIPAETYFYRHPEVLTAGDKAFDLVYGEFLLREEMGEDPTIDEFLHRFPQYAAEFHKQAKVHEAIEANPSSQATNIFPPPSGSIETKGSVSLLASQSGEVSGIRAAETDWPVIPGYTILGKIGQGGMGQVFKARQMRLDRTVALKVIRKDCLSQEPKAARRFQREAQAAAQLSHPNIIVIYDFDNVGDTYYIAMEYVDGVDLDQLVRESGPLPVDQAVDFVRQAALGLQHAHASGMVHRDIKPSNLLIALSKRDKETRRPEDKETGKQREINQATSLSLSPGVSLSPSQLKDATLKILDMGMALLLQGPGGDTSHRTMQGTLMGTPDFIAPEQAVDSHAVDIRADLYSLGCTLYYLLAGRPPFAEYPLLKKLMMHQTAQPKSVREWRPEVPPAIEAIVQRLMAKRPEDRFQTPGDLAEVLETLSLDVVDPIFGPLAEAGLLKGSPRADTPKRGSATGETAKRRDGAGSDRLQASSDRLPAVPAEPAEAGHHERAEDRTSRIEERESKSAAPTLDPRPSTVDSRSRSRQGRESREGGLKPAERTAVLKGHGSWVMALAFSPNRKTLASGAVHGAVRLWNFSGRRQWDKVDLQTQLTEVHVLAFSANNLILAAGSGSFDGLVWLWDVSTPNPSQIAMLQGHHTPVEAIAFSPDGKMLVTGGSDKTVRWWDWTESQAKQRAVFKGHFDRVKAVAFVPDVSAESSAGSGGRAGKGGAAQKPTLISASLDGTVRFWRKGGIWSKEQLEVLEGPWGPVHTMAVSPLGNVLAFGGLDQTVRLFTLPKDSQRCHPLHVFRGHGGVVRLVAFTAKGNTLVSVCDVGRVIIWDLASGNKQQEWQLPVAKQCSLAVTHDGHYLAAGTSDGIVNIFRLYSKTKEPDKPDPGPPSLAAPPTG